MYLYSELLNYKGNINIAIIGCGKFISMFLAQYYKLKNITIHTIVDISLEKAIDNCKIVGLKEETISNISFTKTIDSILDNIDIKIVIEATGNAIAGVKNAKLLIENNKNVIMVNVEADVVAGKYLSDLALKHNVIYSMAYGDQPSLIIEQIEWGLLNGFDVISAGKGTKYHKSYRYSTPDTVWSHYDITEEEALKAGMNPKMFNSFITGDKSYIEMVAVANGSHLEIPYKGLNFPPIDIKNIPKKIIPKNKGGLLQEKYQVEVISSIDENKEKICDNLRWGVFVVLEGTNKYIKDCFKQYGLITDDSGTYSALWRPYHFIGLELAQSIYAISLKKQATGRTKFFKADVVSVAKKNLYKGEILDGEGGFSVYGIGVSAKLSKKTKPLPLGLSDGARVKELIKKNEIITMDKVEVDYSSEITVARDYQYKLLE